MDFTIPSAVTYLMAWAAMVRALWFFFEKADDVFSDKIKGDLSGWLSSAGTGLSSLDKLNILKVFDQLFGSDWLGSRRIVTSVLFTGGLTVVFYLFHGYVVTMQKGDVKISSGGNEIYALSGFLANLVFDFLSLVQTRWVLTKMRGRRSFVQLLWLVVDWLCTSFVALCLVAMGLYFSVFFFTDVKPFNWFNSVMQFGAHVSVPQVNPILVRKVLLGYWQQLLSGENYFLSGFPINLWVFSTYVSSVWVWLYLIGSIITKLLYSLKGYLSSILQWFDVENDPFKSVGYVIICIVSVLFLLYPLTSLFG